MDTYEQDRGTRTESFNIVLGLNMWKYEMEMDVHAIGCPIWSFSIMLIQAFDANPFPCILCRKRLSIALWRVAGYECTAGDLFPIF